MPLYVPWIIGILTGIIVCAQTQEKRWVKSFLISAVIIVIGNAINIEQGDFSYLIGQSFGIALVTGSAGFGIGSAIFRKKRENVKTWDNMSNTDTTNQTFESKDETKN